jgi:two-component system, sensor histidine kinase YesM
MRQNKHFFVVSLKSALLFGILSIVSVMLIASYIFIYINIRDIIIRQHQESIVRSMQLEGKSLQQYVVNIEHLTLNLQYNSYVLSSIQPKSNDDTVNVIKLRRLLMDAFRDKLDSVKGVNWICLILQNGSMIGASSNLTSYHLQAHDFIQNNVYNAIINQSTGCLWRGGYNDAMFSQYPDSPYIESMFSRKVLLCARRIAVNTMNEVHNSQNILILAIDESEIYNQIAYFTSAPFDNVCLFNDKGDLLLCRNEKQAAFLSEYYNKSDKATAPKSDITNIDGKAMHVVSMRLDNGWSILCTVPMQYYYSAIQPSLNILFGAVGIALILVNIWCALLITQATKQLKAMTRIIELVGATRAVKMNEKGRIKEYNALSVQFNAMMLSASTASAEKRRLEIQFLQSQIKPHFLYNTILSIRMMADIVGAQSVADALLYLGDIIRPIFECSSEVWQLKQEIQLLDNYAKLMELRFGKHAEYSISVDASANELMVPRLLLQPLLENCYMHSIRGDSFITIAIDARVVENGWVLCITDNGQGMLAEVLGRIRQSMREPTNDGDAIGIANVYYRLQKYYGDDFEMHIDSESGKGTSVTISLNRLIP